MHNKLLSCGALKIGPCYNPRSGKPFFTPDTLSRPLFHLAKMSSNSAGMINIRRDVKDLYYRYKMPRLVSKIEGKGNGIKTVVSNMVDIAKALNRPPAYVTKFFGSEVGSLTVCDEKAARYIVNGAHEAEKLQNILDSFISKFVLCTSCENPETDLSVSKDGTIYRNCKACGHRSTVDMAHKLCTFIQKNPPPKPKKVGNANKGATSSGDAELTKSGEGDASAAGNGDEGAEDEGMAAPEGIEEGFIRTTNGFADDDDDWAEGDEEEREAELAGLSARVRDSLSLSKAKKASKTARAMSDKDYAALDAFAAWFEADVSVSNDSILAQIGERDLRDDRALAVVLQVLCKPESLMSTLQARLPLLQKLCHGPRGVKALLGSLERIVAVHHPALLSATAGLLQFVYNNDLVDDDDVLAWNGKISLRYVDAESGKKVRKAAEPFVNWLQNAESDDDEDDEEEEDDE